MQILTLSRTAMATRFELVLCGEDTARLRAAGQEALDEIERLDAQLSLYRRDSELSGINARAAKEPVKVTPQIFNLLQLAAQIHDNTEGAFDITIAPLMRCWGFINGKGAEPAPDNIRAALDLVGMRHVILDEGSCTVCFDRDGVTLDLGAIGKGYAVQQAAEIIREAGITSALIHGGTSSIYAIGAPPDGTDWLTAIRHPADPEKILAKVGLKNSSLSVSAAHGKSFHIGSVEFGHVIDPRTGYPSQNAVLAAVVGPDATQGDALSTALLVLGESWLPELIDENKGMKGLVAKKDESGEISVMKIGFEDRKTG